MEHETTHKATATDEWEQVIGTQVHRARVARGLSQAQLSSLAGISVSTLSNLERGIGSSLSTVVSVVRALGSEECLKDLVPVPNEERASLKRGSRESFRVRVRGSSVV